MTPKNKIYVNLVVVLLLGAVSVGWVLLNLVGNGTLDKPYTVTADFASTGGVFTNQEVTYRGFLIGRVGALDLNDDGVDIELVIDPEWRDKIPRDVVAAIRSKSAVGEQFVNLTPLSSSTAMLEPGDTIPREHTELPVDFQELLQSLDRVLADVSPGETRDLVTNLSAGIQGHSEDIAEILRSLGTLSKAFASTADEQQRLLDNATTTGSAFLSSKDDFAAAIRAGDEVLAGIGDEPEELKALFAANDRLARRGIALLSRRGRNIEEGIDALADLAEFQYDNRNEVIIKSLRYVPQFIQAVEDASVPWRSPDGREFYRIRIGLIYDNVPSTWPCKYEVPEDYERFPHEREKRDVIVLPDCEPQPTTTTRAEGDLAAALAEWLRDNPEAAGGGSAVLDLTGEPGDEAAAAELGFSWPLDGPVTSGFGRRYGRMHTGIDIDGVTGDSVVASAAGTVIASGTDDGGYGEMVAIDHGHGFVTLYAHLSAIEVERGDELSAGDLVGKVGCTGSCTGDHLHFEIRSGGLPVDPMHYLVGGYLYTPDGNGDGDAGANEDGDDETARHRTGPSGIRSGWASASSRPW